MIATNGLSKVMRDVTTTSRPARVQLVSKPGSVKSGIGRYTIELERGLRERGVNVQRTALRSPVPSWITSLAQRAGYDLDAFFRSYPIRTSYQPERITHITSQSLGVLLLTQRLPSPVIVTVHDILPYLLRNNPDLNIYRNRAHRTMDSLSMRGLKRADCLIACSHFTKQTVVDALRIPGDRIHVVHSGVDSQQFRPRTVPEAFTGRYGLHNDRRYILYVGSEEPRKNIPALLRAFAQLHQREPGVVLLKVGSAAFAGQRQRHLQLCRDLGISQAVHWYDDVPESDLPLFYNFADVSVFPSLFEGFGFPVLEALACGTPVVAARASSVRELAGDAARLLDDLSPESLSAALLEEMDRCQIGGEQRAEWARRFSWESTLAATMACYREVLRLLPQSECATSSSNGVEGQFGSDLVSHSIEQEVGDN